jgi:hypothetical protein
LVIDHPRSGGYRAKGFVVTPDNVHRPNRPSRPGREAMSVVILLLALALYLAVRNFKPRAGNRVQILNAGLRVVVMTLVTLILLGRVG